MMDNWCYNNGMMTMINVTYNGNKTINIQDEDETDLMQGSLLDCFCYSCSWAKDGEEINFHIKNTNQDEILKLKKHLEKQTTQPISNDKDNELRVKIKTEYAARNVIKHIYQEYNQPSTHNLKHTKQQTQIEEQTPTNDKIGILGIIGGDEDGLSIQDLL